MMENSPGKKLLGKKLLGKKLLGKRYPRKKYFHKKRTWHVTLLPGVVLTGTIILLRALGTLQVVEWKALDLAMRWRPAEATDPRIAIVTVTDADIQSGLGHPPSDRDLAQLLNTLQKYEPRVIGIDIFRDRPVREGAALLRESLNASNIFSANTITGRDPVDALPFLPEEQVGFVDNPVDKDGFLRRSYLGVADSEGQYRFSLVTQLVKGYLASEGLRLDNGRRDVETIRFGETEIPRVQPNTGGYVRADNGGNQVLINVRAGKHPFEVFSYQEVISGAIEPEQLHDKLVLVGYTARSAKDFVSSGAVAGVNPSLVPGVTMHAHIASQILSAVYVDRPFLKTLPNALEYLLLVGSGLLGVMLLRRRLKPIRHVWWAVVIAIVTSLLYYGLLLVGWWLPLVPVLMSFSLNAIALPFYQAQKRVSAQLEERESLIEAVYTNIHNGPLQRIAVILSSWPEEQSPPPEMREELEVLNRELRAVREVMRQEMLSPDDQLVIANRAAIDLDIPLHEMLYEAYQATLSRHRNFFSTIVQLTTFEPMTDDNLSTVQKRKLGRFLEEMLNNVVRHARTATRLTVICQRESDRNIIRITDNAKPAVENPVSGPDAGPISPQPPTLTGSNHSPKAPRTLGYGTKHAQQLASSLGGQFSRTALQPRGTCCELMWPV